MANNSYSALSPNQKKAYDSYKAQGCSMKNFAICDSCKMPLPSKLVGLRTEGTTENKYKCLCPKCSKKKNVDLTSEKTSTKGTATKSGVTVQLTITATKGANSPTAQKVITIHAPQQFNRLTARKYISPVYESMHPLSQAMRYLANYIGAYTITATFTANKDLTRWNGGAMRYEVNKKEYTTSIVKKQVQHDNKNTVTIKGLTDYTQIYCIKRKLGEL